MPQCNIHITYSFVFLPQNGSKSVKEQTSPPSLNNRESSEMSYFMMQHFPANSILWDAEFHIAKFSAASGKNNRPNNYESYNLNDLNIKERKQINCSNVPFGLVHINCCKGVIGALKRVTKRLQDWFLNCGFQGQEPRLPGQHGQEVLKWESNVAWRFGNCHCLMKIGWDHWELEAAAKQTCGKLDMAKNIYIQ